MVERERRFKVLFLRPEFVIDVLLGFATDHPKFSYLRAPVFPELPKDCEFLACDWSPRDRGFLIVLYSKEWDIVPDGDVMPFIHPKEVAWRFVAPHGEGPSISFVERSEEELARSSKVRQMMRDIMAAKRQAPSDADAPVLVNLVQNTRDAP